MLARPTLSALAVLAVGGLASACAPAQGSAADDIDQAWLDSLYEESVEALQRGAGIRLAEPVPVLLLTADAAKERRMAFSEQLDEDAGVTAAMDVVADFVFSDNMLGRYLPDEKVVYVIEDVVRRHSGGDRQGVEDFLFGILSHELVHAYDDQTYAVMPLPGDLMELVADPAQMGALQTRMSLLEGRAVYAAELASAAAGREPLAAPSLEDVADTQVMRGKGDAASDLAAGLVNAVARAKFVQYVEGRAFSAAAYEFGGEKFFREVFDGLPLSARELADFEEFRQRWAEDMLERMEAEEEGDADAAAGVDGSTAG